MKRLVTALGLNSLFLIAGFPIGDPVIQSVWFTIGGGAMLVILLLSLIRFVVWAMEDL